jgi:hypothetical protein
VNVSYIHESIIKIIWCQEDADVLRIRITNTRPHVFGRGLHANILLMGVMYNHASEVDFKIVKRL